MVPVKSQQGTAAHEFECSSCDRQGCHENKQFSLAPEAKSSRSLPAEPVTIQAAVRMAVLLPKRMAAQ